MKKIYTEIRGRIKEDDSSVPFKDGDYAYFSRTLEGQQYSQICRTDRDGENETILLDINKEAGDRYFRSGGATHSPDHTLLAWSADRNGSEYFTIFVRDLETGNELKDEIKSTTGGVTWAADSKSFFYTVQDDNHRPHKVFHHKLGDDPADDAMIYEEPDSGFFLGVGKTNSGNYIIIDSHDHETSEVRFIDAHTLGAPTLVAARQNGREYSIDDANGLFYIRTNDQAQRTTNWSPRQSTIPALKTGQIWCRTARVCCSRVTS